MGVDGWEWTGREWTGREWRGVDGGGGGGEWGGEEGGEEWGGDGRGGGGEWGSVAEFALAQTREYICVHACTDALFGGCHAVVNSHFRPTKAFSL